MRKEVIVAIVIGFTIGLVITIGIITARNALKGQPKTTATGQTTSVPTPGPAKHAVTITSVGENHVTTSDQFNLRGKTTPAAMVVIIAEEEELMVVADSSGNFERVVPLIGGANLIEVVSFSPTGERAETDVTVIYTTAEF